MSKRMTKFGNSGKPPDSARVLLFPLCDSRGMLSRMLQGQSNAVVATQFSARAHSKSRADSIFFAWLLDLPASVDPAAAANAILLVADQCTQTCDRAAVIRANFGSIQQTAAGALTGVSSNGSDYGRHEFNERLQHLLRTVINDTPLYQGDDLDSIIDEVRRADMTDRPVPE